MGLQNSGVSDIFQANAFSSYLANMNNAANARIAANKQNKALYNAYIAEKKGIYQAQREQNYSNALQYVTTQLNSGFTDLEKLKEQVKTIYNLSDEELTRISGTIDVLGNQTGLNVIENEIRGMFTDDEGNYKYTGSDTQMTDVKSVLKGRYSDAAIEEALNSLNDQLSQLEGAVVSDILKPENRILTDDVIEIIKDTIDKGAYDAEIVQKTLGGDLESVLNDPDAFKEGYTFAGVDKDKWNEMTDESKVNTILNKASQLKKEGLISEKTWSDAVSDHIKTSISTAREDKKNDEWFDEKNDNRYSFVILNTAADLALFYKEQYENGELSREEYDAICVEINNQLDEDERKGLYKNMEVYTKDASGFDQFVESMLQWLPEAGEDAAKIWSQAITAITVVGLPFTAVQYGLGEFYDWLVDNPQEANFFDVWNGLDTEGKHALADIYMAAGPENRVEKPWYQGGLKGWVTQNAINQANKKKTSE
jgi:hypothetical protein